MFNPNERESEREQPYQETTEWENDNTGGKVRVTRRNNGSSTVHWGGPVGDVEYDRFGEQK